MNASYFERRFRFGGGVAPGLPRFRALATASFQFAGMARRFGAGPVFFLDCSVSFAMFHIAGLNFCMRSAGFEPALASKRN